jgi:putative glutamine amidotransferase
MKKPVIGIVLDLAQDSNKYAYAPLPWYAMRKCYSDAVITAGGLPIMLPYSQDYSALLNIIDGLIIPGGDEDINPKFYGRDIISNKIKTNDIRAEFELNLVKQALKMNMPILGICNGLQVINTVFGGTLIQHIPDVVNSNVNHEQPAPKHVPTHSIVIESNSLLAKLAESTKIMVNSTHHQAIETLGKGLDISALAEDGIIEAVESTDYKFLIGVQWHCEYLNSVLDRNLFKRLVEASAVVV